MGLQALQELELRLGANQIMFRAMDLIVGIAIQIIGQEADGLHVGQKATSIGQQTDLRRSQKGLRFLHITSGIGLEDRQVHLHTLQLLIILCAGVGTRANEVTNI